VKLLQLISQPPLRHPATQDANKQQGKGGGRQNRASRTNKPKTNDNASHVPKEKFTARSDDLQGYIYDVTSSRGGVVYKRTTEEIARHVEEKYTNVGAYIRTTIMTLDVPAPTRPTIPIAVGEPPAIDAVEIEIFKEKIRMYVKTEAAIEVAMRSLYDLIWGQCAESLRLRLRGDDQFITYSTTADSLTLLKSIQAKMTGLRDKQYLSHALHQIMRDFYSLFQGKHCSNQDYYDEFNILVLSAEESGATIGTHPGAVPDILANVGQSTAKNVHWFRGEHHTPGNMASMLGSYDWLFPQPEGVDGYMLEQTGNWRWKTEPNRTLASSRMHMPLHPSRCGP
jgi:hypothetical protein